MECCLEYFSPSLSQEELVSTKRLLVGGVVLLHAVPQNIVPQRKISGQRLLIKELAVP